MLTAGAVLLAVALDALVAEPPASVHPVALFGRLVEPVDRAWAHPRAVGVGAAAFLPLLAGGVAFCVVLLTARVDLRAGAAAAGLVLFSTSSLRMLLGAARRTLTGSEADLDAARESLPALAGRDASALTAGQVRSAAVESLAENLADGFVAPLAAFTVAGVAAGALAPALGLPAILALPLAAAAAAWTKAVNTLDSMLGYRSKPVGWAPARLDDLVMWLPARATALLLALAAGRPNSLLHARSHAREPPSPNSGWPMATLADVLGVRLEKPGVYDLGGGDYPTVADGLRALGITAYAGLAAVAAAAGVLWGVAP